MEIVLRWVINTICYEGNKERNTKIPDFAELEQETIELIAKQKFIALSTCTENHTSVRMVSIISNGLDIYFITLNTTAKYQHIKNNPCIAFCIGNMQAEGRAEIIGHPLENEFFTEKYKRCHENTFKIYGLMQETIIIKINPLQVTFWRYDPILGAYKDCLDIVLHSASRQLYNAKNG